MKIVTDSGADLLFPKETLEKLDVITVPLTVSLDDKSYREGIDIKTADFYDLLEASKGLPLTSTPSPGDFAEVYKKIAKTDPDILSVHISSGLSGTYNAAIQGADLVPEANVTHFDAKTLSAAVGWMIEAASRAIKAGWSKDKVVALMQKVSDASNSVYTLKELKYLINGGRISHMKGLLANLLNIKPVIGVEKVGGTYEQLGQERNFKRALDGLVKQIKSQHALGSKLRVQVLHAFNPESAALLKEKIDQLFEVEWLPIGVMSLVLGAHTGPSMVGVAYAAQSIFDELP
ncbi:MAG: DegV family protein [Chloroflexi bacterium]|jgi:DegV family protein with EDD domain|nr:DegV family protein [Chloroflexota bacterium]MBT3669787.1 DegV family protein [Chloroflexota bacterium]MBT4003856.1 DegV family protein [Chloroflexota bacterium]MBT4304688.1 DegV family protein [Chloroflexota bacterium]MBT4534810.1 DegV family protein [Chloroflexota bacterium]